MPIGVVEQTKELNFFCDIVTVFHCIYAINQSSIYLFQKESHFFQVTGESQKTLLFIVGGDALYPDVESLGVLSHSSAEEG